ncbi:MAG TPA: ATP-binding protein, partial [Ignavibacteriaceae bacterium]
MNRLIGRDYEIEKLNAMLITGQPDFLAVYGRRRVGKTFLIRQHLKSNIVFDFTGTKDGATEQQLTNFYDEYIKRIKT